MNDPFLYSITDALPAAIYKIRIGGSPWRVFEFVSHGFENLFEIPREIVLRDFESFWAMVNDEDRMRIDESSRISMQSRTMWCQDFRVLTQSNSLKWVRGTSFPEQPSEDGTIAWNGVFVDITEQKSAEMALRQSMERFQLVVDGAIDGLWDAVVEPGVPWHSPDTKIFYSPRLKALLGFADDEFENRLGSWYDRLHPGDKERVMKALVDHIDRRVPYEIEYRLLTKTGEYRWFQARGQAVWDEQGNITRMAGALNDIHRRKMAEEQLRQAQKLEAVGTLASGIAHEFDNLLAAISIHVNLAKTTLPASHPAVRSLEQVETTARHARGVTNGLLTFSHRASPQRSVIDLPSVIRTTLDLLGRILRPGVRIEAQLPADRTIWIHASASLVEQIFLNLAINAQDAMPAGGRIRVVVESLDGRDGGDFAGKVRVVFSDNGAGIQPADLPRIFEPFFTTKARGKGTGLGLSIVMEIIRDLQGTIEVNSEPGVGTTFIMHFDCCPPPTTEAAAVMPVAAPVAHHEILLIERDRHVQSIIKSSLAAEGWTVSAASSAEEAVEMLRTGAAAKLIVADMDSLSPKALDHVLAMSEEAMDRTLVLVVGTFALSVKDARLAKHILLRKPFEMHELIGLVSDCLRGGRREE